MANIGGIGGDIESLGNAASALFSSQGNAAEADSYSSAASLEEQNAQLTAASTRIQETQTARQVAQSLGTTQADVASAGFTQSGSALDIMRSSAQQGALAKSLINIQGAINENSFAAEAGADEAKAKAANEANQAGTVSAIASIGGALIDGSTKLASAGKTISSGVDYVKGLFSSDIDNYGAIDPAEETGDLYMDAFANDSLVSTTDSAISSGADIGGFLDSSAIGADTSGFSIGSSLDTVSDAISNVFDTVGDGISSAFSAVGDGVSDAISSVFGADIAGEIGADFIPGLNIALLADKIPGVSKIPVVGDVLDGISNAVGGIVDGIGNAIGGLFGSVICTALYKRGYLTRQVWHGAQCYGRDVAPDHIYSAYLAWGRPIARAIAKSEIFAMLAAPLFVPWAHELAVRAGEKTARSTMFGRAVFRVTYAFSWVMGKMMTGENVYVEA